MRVWPVSVLHIVYDQIARVLAARMHYTPALSRVFFNLSLNLRLCWLESQCQERSVSLMSVRYECYIC